MLGNVLQLVSYDILVFLRKNAENKNIDTEFINRKMLIGVRSKATALNMTLEVNGFERINTLIKQSSENVNVRPSNNNNGSEIVVYLLMESSILARKVLNGLSSFIENIYYDESQPDERNSSRSDFFRVNGNELDFIVNYLEWYQRVLGLFLSEKIHIDDVDESLSVLDKFKSKIIEDERRENIRLSIKEIHIEANDILSSMKNDIVLFTNQSVISASEKISDNMKESNDKIEEFKSLIAEFNQVRRKQAEYFEDIQLVHDFCEKRKKGIEDIFIASNRQGMAKSFSNMANGLILPMLAWASIFIFALVAISISGFLINKEFPQAQNINELGIAFILKLMIISPLIWMAWFSGRQFGHTSKLRQDYSYKSAVAMAYQGYKSEAVETSSDMHQKLLNNIVEHFSDNPVRLYEKQDSSSPLEEVLKKLPQEKLSEIIKSIRGG